MMKSRNRVAPLHPRTVSKIVASHLALALLLNHPLLFFVELAEGRTVKRLILFVIAVTITLAGSASGQSAKQKAAIEQEIRKLDLAHADAILRADLVTLDKLWTEDFRVNNPFNEIDKADRIRTGAVTYSSFIRVPESILIHGETVIVMGRETVVPKGSSPDAGKQLTAVIRISG